MKIINLLSAFSVCSLLIFSANGMEKDDTRCEDLTKSIRIIPSKTGGKGWYANLADYFCGYKNNTDKLFKEYFNQKVIPNEQLQAASNYTHWSINEQIQYLATNLKTLQSNSSAIKSFLEIKTITLTLEELVRKSEKHGIKLTETLKTKISDSQFSTERVSLRFTASITNTALQTFQSTHRTATKINNRKLKTNKMFFLNNILADEMTELYKEQRSQIKK